jgi:ABC-type bacteriocin/lantibiotic exporter with double-glycine peptidase domain
VKNRTLSKILDLLPNNTLKRLGLISSFQIFVTIFDIFAILLLGTISKLGLEFVQGKPTAFPENIVNFLHMDLISFEVQFALASSLVLALFSARTAMSIVISKRLLIYLGNQAGNASNKLMRELFSSRPDYILAKNSQEIVYSVTTGIDNLTLNLLGSSVLLVTEIFFLVAVILITLVVEPVTGLCAIVVFGGAFYLIHRATSHKAKGFSKDLGNLGIRYNQNLLETLGIYRELVLRGLVDSSIEEIQKTRSLTLNISARLMNLPLLSKYLFEFLLIIGSAIVCLTQLLISDANTAISSLIIFLAASSRLLPSLIRAQGSLLSIKQSEGGAHITLLHLKEINEKFRDLPRLKVIPTFKHEFEPRIKIESVKFAYSKPTGFSLQNISLEIEPGQFVAIVGESGSGKTTLVDLILGMLSPDSGSIKISNLSPKDAVSMWPGAIAYVPQDIAIIEGSVRRNVCLDSGGSFSDEALMSSIGKAHLIEDVLRMPEKLEQNVGERGTKLSGGQRQRLGIARALFTDPKLIVFDEATSSLDPITERAVTDAIYKREGNVTLIVIAHRLSTVKNADVVVLLDKGKLIAKGSFEEVRKREPKFDAQARLVNL